MDIDRSTIWPYKDGEPGEFIYQRYGHPVGVEAAAAQPAPVVVDATAATPIYLRPLEQGADFVLHSATKYLGGHDDTLLGAVVCKGEEDAERLKEFRTRSGIVAAPDPCALLLRGLETLESRVRRQTESATELARRLKGHPAVETVRYAGIGGLLSFDVAGADEARHVETSIRLITNATSLGGIHSLLEARARWEGDRVPPGLLRLSVGLEPVEELWADLAQALKFQAGFPPARKISAPQGESPPPITRRRVPPRPPADHPSHK